MAWFTFRLRFEVIVALFLGVTLTGVSAGASTHWSVLAGAGNSTEAKSLTPTAPTGVTATCVSATTTRVTVTWTAASHATGYTVYSSKTDASYTVVGTSTTTSYTTAALTTAAYTFEVTTSIGTKWASVKSSASASRSMNDKKDTCK